MYLTARNIGEELAYYRALQYRRQLLGHEAKKLSVLERGFCGECVYDEIFDEVGHGSVFVFRDIYLQIEDSIVQYDSLIVSDEGIVSNEIKNYSGLYRYKEGSWFINNNQVSEDALGQMRRAVGKLLKLRYQSRGEFDISGKIVFPHIEFRLRSQDEDLQGNVVLRSELRNYLMQFKNSYAGRKAENIARLIEKHIIPNPFFDKSADSNAVRKGLYCYKCRSFELADTHFYMTCERCGNKEKKETHVLRAISDFKFLFFNEKMTKQRFLQFIDYQVSQRTVFRLLNKYCDQIIKGKWTYYVFRYYDFAEAYRKYEVTSRYKDKVLVK